MDNETDTYKITTYHTVTFTHYIKAPDYVTASRMGRELQGKNISEIYSRIQDMNAETKETGIVMPIDIEQVKES